MHRFLRFGRKEEFEDVPMKLPRKRERERLDTQEDLGDSYDLSPDEGAQPMKQYFYDEKYEVKQPPKWPMRLAAAGTGFGMGFFVGSSVVLLHGLLNPQIRRMGFSAIRPQAVGLGFTFGTIFAGGQLLQTW
eukprot:CAMPEP_0167758960 /NCGR_PEP_ID=MMETSP0110_2-20121227/10760_1 /TAXON_ID=629695 /ORGANISM="Gymnochlora sp., Strain CCMP2014" /LENGTH=131 /DNA_ID=CAMNT_0007645297 /DNA_START=60 /DNA_END=455 /DNA_ORIENTATION=+